MNVMRQRVGKPWCDLFYRASIQAESLAREKPNTWSTELGHTRHAGQRIPSMFKVVRGSSRPDQTTPHHTTLDQTDSEHLYLTRCCGYSSSASSELSMNLILTEKKKKRNQLKYSNATSSTGHIYC